MSRRTKHIPAVAFSGFTLHSRYHSLTVTMDEDGSIELTQDGSVISLPPEARTRFQRGVQSLGEIPG